MRDNGEYVNHAGAGWPVGRFRSRPGEVGDDGALPGPVDFFVSYTSADRPWAEWIAWELEAAGYSTRIQAWDMRPGSNFVVEMDSATQVAERTIAVLSPAFLESAYARAECAAARAEDPTGEQRKLVPVRVRECDPRGLLRAVVYVDVVDLSEQAASAALLAGVRAGRAKPVGAPDFPGLTAPRPAGERVRRPDAGAAIFNAPETTRTFSGRSRALEQLAGGLAAREDIVAVTQVHAIHGLGGVGKTQLAARYAWLHREEYDVIWWLRAERTATALADLAGLAVALGLVDVDVEEPAAVAAARAWLARNGRWLLVFDNAPSPDAIRGLMPDCERGHVVITSRAHADWRSLGALPVALDVWEREESLAFLSARTGERDPGVLDVLAGALGDLPLALEQAAAYTNAKAITLVGYLERMRDRAPDLFSAGRPAGYEHTVATVWKLALEQIAEHPIARDVIGVCAHLAAERIPRELLDAWPAVTGPATGPAGAVDDAIELLLRYALLTVDSDATVAMHRLVQQVARDAAPAPRLERAAANAVALIAQVLPRRAWEREHWPACQRLLPHGLSATAHARKLHVAREQTARVLAGLGHFQQARADFAGAKQLTMEALNITEAVRGDTHPHEVAITLDNLGTVLRQLGEFQNASREQERALAIFETVYGPEDPEVAITLSNLGILRRQLDDLHDARQRQERALAIFEVIFEGTGGYEHEIASTLNSLGIVLKQLNELEAARDAQQRALEINERVYGPDHPSVALTLGCLGNVLSELGELDAACDQHERALAIKTAVYGTDHPEYASTLGNLGNVLRKLGKLQEARAAHELSLEIDEKVYGPQHPEVARAAGNLAKVQRQLGELKVARDNQQRSLAIFEGFLGRRHSEVAITLENLAIVRQQLDDPQAARCFQQRALDIFQCTRGPTHPWTTQAQRILATMPAPGPRQ